MLQRFGIDKCVAALEKVLGIWDELLLQEKFLRDASFVMDQMVYGLKKMLKELPHATMIQPGMLRG